METKVDLRSRCVVMGGTQGMHDPMLTFCQLVFNAQQILFLFISVFAFEVLNTLVVLVSLLDSGCLGLLRFLVLVSHFARPVWSWILWCGQSA